MAKCCAEGHQVLVGSGCWGAEIHALHHFSGCAPVALHFSLSLFFFLLYLFSQLMLSKLHSSVIFKFLTTLFLLHLTHLHIPLMFILQSISNPFLHSTRTDTSFTQTNINSHSIIVLVFSFFFHLTVWFPAILSSLWKIVLNYRHLLIDFHECYVQFWVEYPDINLFFIAVKGHSDSELELEYSIWYQMILYFCVIVMLISLHKWISLSWLLCASWIPYFLSVTPDWNHWAFLSNESYLVYCEV